MKKILSFLVFIMSLFSSNSFADPNMIEKENAKRALINKIRGGDYLNAGDTKAIDYVLEYLKNIENISSGNILDLGSGYGGGTNYFYKHGFKKIWGVDINQNAVDYANLKYPHIKFFHLDGAHISKKFKKDFFSLIYMFNVIYAIEDKTNLIKSLSKVSKKGARLVIFDYSKTDTLSESNKEKPMKDFSGQTMHPIEVSNLHFILKKSGWRVTTSKDITDKYIEWYEQFLKDFSSNRSVLLKSHKQKEVEDVENLFNKILFNLRNNIIGGTLIIAEKL